MKRLSFRSQVMGWSVLLAASVLVVFYLVSVRSVTRAWRDELDERLQREARPILAQLEEMRRAGRRPEQGAEESFESPAGLRVLRLRRGDETYVLTPSLDALSIKATPDRSNGKTCTVTGNHGKWRVAFIEEEAWYGAFARPMDELNGEISKLNRRVLRTLPLVIVVLVGGAWWVSGRMTKPVRDLARIIEEMRPDDLTVRASDDGVHDELGRLVRSWNALMDRLEDSFRQARRFSADASHELKTPLAALQSRVESALRNSPPDSPQQRDHAAVLERIAELGAMLDALLLLSRSDAGKLPLARERLDLSTLAAEAADDAAAEFEVSGGTLAFESAGKTIVEGDPRLLHMTLANLFANARKYNLPTGGSIRCRLYTEPGRAVFAIANTGPPIPGEDRAHLFKRFFRARSARAGAHGGQGLGLSLAQAVIDAHGGAVFLHKSDADSTEFRVALPLAEEE